MEEHTDKGATEYNYIGSATPKFFTWLMNEAAPHLDKGGHLEDYSLRQLCPTVGVLAERPPWIAGPTSRT